MCDFTEILVNSAFALIPNPSPKIGRRELEMALNSLLAQIWERRAGEVRAK
jgi:hypothetical protein